MTFVVAVGLFIQLCALAMVIGTCGRRWIAHIGAVFVVVAFVYHGLTEVVQVLFPDTGYSLRVLVSSEDIDGWMIRVSGALLVFALTYSVASRYFRVRHPPRDTAELAQELQNALDWRLVLVLLVPAYLVTLGDPARRCRELLGRGAGSAVHRPCDHPYDHSLPAPRDATQNSSRSADPGGGRVADR